MNEMHTSRCINSIKKCSLRITSFTPAVLCGWCVLWRLFDAANCCGECQCAQLNVSQYSFAYPFIDRISSAISLDN